MTAQAPSVSKSVGSVLDVQQQVLSRIASLSYLPTTAAVALKFVELGKNPDAEPAEYARVISADTALSTKLLALANSSWAGVRNRVTTTRTAVNLLGLGTVRTLAISYCMTGLHNELKLSHEESELFWESSLLKAVTARQFAGGPDSKKNDEAFVAGLFQDFALTVMYSVLRGTYLAVLQDPNLGSQQQLQKERELFGLDHTEVGRALAQKLELPELYVDAIAFHHNYMRLQELIAHPTLRDAVYASALLPHLPSAWAQSDIDALEKFWQRQRPNADLMTFLQDVQREFAQLFSFFHQDAQPKARLEDLHRQAARQAADETTHLVRQMQRAVEKAASQGLPPGKPLVTNAPDAQPHSNSGFVADQP